MLLGLALMACRAHAGGSGFNTIVIVNQASSNSCELGAYYCQQRLVPPQNVLCVNWSGGNTLWSSNDLQTNLVTPLLNLLASQQLTNQIQYVVLSMDLPFQTSMGATVNSTTTALFYGLRAGDGSDHMGTTNSYAASEGMFNPSATVGAPGYSFLTTMLTGNSLTEAEQLINQGVASDGTFPQQPVILAKSSDVLRNIRYVFFDDAVFNVDILGVSEIFRTNTDAVWSAGACGGYEAGLADYNVPSCMFAPGAVADSLTSFGGVIFGNNSQTSELAFTGNGAAGSYGTVAEPENDTQKFPNPQVYFYQARGFSLAESYYQSVNAPYLGLMVAEPLAAPFAVRGKGQWSTNMTSAVLTGTTNLSVNFIAHDSNHPLQQVDLFVDGVYYTTLTNVAPGAGNVLTYSLNGFPINYTVPTNATVSTVASGLGAQINTVSNVTQVKALIYGDRLELEAISTNPAAAPYFIPDNTPASTPGLAYTVNYLTAASAPQITPTTPNKSGAFSMKVGIPSALTYVLMASTNLVNWQPIFTNTTPGLLNFTDYGSTNYPQRFYCMTWPVANQPPQLSTPQKAGVGAVQMQASSVAGQAWAIQTSTDLVNWVSVFTNQPGGASSYLDSNMLTAPARFYRATLVSPPAPAFTVINAGNLNWVRVNSASLPYTVAISTNAGPWRTIDTNFAIGQIQASASSMTGSNATLTTFLNAAQPTFMASPAQGMQGYTVINTATPTNAWIQFTFTLTNGQPVVVKVTNQAGGNAIALASQIVSAINATPALQGSNGVVADDYQSNGGTATFNVYARNPGFAAAGIRVQPAEYMVIMTTTPGTLTQNQPNLEPRNHLYVTAGAARLGVTFALATTNWSDGYHQLTAVAYEGSNVRTETPVTVPVQIQNSSLSAMMTLLDVTSPAPVQNTYHIQVTANTNTVSQITLYSTGGAVGSSNNVSTVVFPVAGTNLWGGAHPFYAVVKTVDGLAYRTQTQTITLVDSP